MAFKPVFNYSDLLKRSRSNQPVPGFDFDVDSFENLVDSFVPLHRFPSILNCSFADLDTFCHRVYGSNFKETYNRLSGISDMWMRRAFSNLASNGNATAINVVAKHFMGLSDEPANSNINISFLNDLKEDD